MHLLKCENEHIYDSDKFRTCPHCSRITFDAAGLDIYGLNQADVDTEIPGDELQENYERIAMRRTVGMLVCVEGAMLGEGFLLKEGENSIGRASNMDVALTREVTISRKEHAIIYYDRNTDSFTLTVGKEDAVVLCNDVWVKTNCRLQDRDELVLGECRLVFVEAGNVWQIEGRK
jgi:acetyltransferase-like isoleucine patch superfamily enzyme